MILKMNAEDDNEDNNFVTNEKDDDEAIRSFHKVAIFYGLQCLDPH